MYPTIVSVGAGLPQRTLTNQQIINIANVDVSPQALEDQTGVRVRHWVQDEQTSDLATAAARQALAGIGKSKLASIHLATCTPDHPSPNTASIVHDKLDGPEACLAVDLHGSCAGSIMALEAAAHRVLAEPDGSSALVIGADTLSRHLDRKDAKTIGWFGDGAGAVVVQKRDQGQPMYTAMITQPNKQALHTATDQDPCGIIRLGDAKAVKRHAIDTMTRAAIAVAEKAGLYHPDDGIDWSAIDYFIPHQASADLINQVAEMLGVPDEKCVRASLPKHGNTSSASIFLALNEGLKSGQIKPGRSRTLFASVGAGFVGGAVLINTDLTKPHSQAKISR